MGLGRLLLKGFSHKRKSPKPSRLTSTHSKKRTSASSPRAHKIPKSKTALVQVQAAENAQSKPPGQSIQAMDLVRPNDRLKKSIEAFLLDQRSLHTRRAYGKDLKRFVAFLLDRKLRLGPEMIDRGLVIAYKDMLLSEKLQHTTIDRHLATLRSFFRWLVEG